MVKYSWFNTYIHIPTTFMRLDLHLSKDEKSLIRSAASFVLASIFYVMAFMILKVAL